MRGAKAEVNTHQNIEQQDEIRDRLNEQNGFVGFGPPTLEERIEAIVSLYPFFHFRSCDSSFRTEAGKDLKLSDLDFAPFPMSSTSPLDDSPLFSIVSFESETAAFEQFFVYWLQVNFLLFLFLGCELSFEVVQNVKRKKQEVLSFLMFDLLRNSPSVRA